MKKLLLTTDLSNEALRPFPAVADMARKLGFSVTLLHVIEDVAIAPHGAPLAPPVHAPSVAGQVEAAREALAAKRETLGSDLEVETAVESGADVARTIADHAREHGFDMIAMSSHGRSGFRRMILGSIAEAVLRHASVPVLVFPRAE